MRKKFVECETRFQAQKECPWANHIAKVTDGFMCFESKTEFNVWSYKSKSNNLTFKMI
jgi:hypothetical protein